MPPGHLSLEETPGQTQKSPEGLHISSGLKTPQDAPGGAGKCCWREGRLLTKPAAQATQPWVSREGWMDGWMETALLFTSRYNISIRKTCFCFRNANKATSVVVFFALFVCNQKKGGRMKTKRKLYWNKGVNQSPNNTKSKVQWQKNSSQTERAGRGKSKNKEVQKKVQKLNKEQTKKSTLEHRRHRPDVGKWNRLTDKELEKNSSSSGQGIINK